MAEYGCLAAFLIAIVAVLWAAFAYLPLPIAVLIAAIIGGLIALFFLMD